MILQVCVVTPNKLILNTEAEEVILPANTGLIGILTDHAPLVTSLDIGTLMFRVQEGAGWTSIVIMGGFAFVEHNEITVIAHEAESETMIDANEVEKTFYLTKKQFEEAKDTKERIEANCAYKLAKARYHAIYPIFK